MKRLVLTVALAAFTTPVAAGAATWSPKDVQRAVYAGAALTAVGLVVYNNERIHHRADVARDAEIKAALAERNVRLQGRALPVEREIVEEPVRPTMRARYICTMVDPMNGECLTLRAAPR